MYHYCQWSCCSWRTQQFWSGCSSGAIWWRFCSYWWKNCHFKSGRRRKSFCRTMVDRGTQKPIIPMIQWKNQAYRRKTEMRADIIEIVQDTKMKCLVCAWWPEWPFARDSTQQKNGTLRLVSLKDSVGPTLLSLVKEYQESAVKEKKTRKKGTEWQNNFYWQFLEKLQNNTYWGENTRTCTSKAELKQPAVLGGCLPKEMTEDACFPLLLQTIHTIFYRRSLTVHPKQLLQHKSTPVRVAMARQ